MRSWQPSADSEHELLALPSSHRATGLVRTLVIASATLAILVVSFSIYQYGLADPDGVERHSIDRLPAPPVVPAGFDRVDPAGGLEVGEGVVGPGQKVHITFYRDKADPRSSIEVSVDSLAPGSGAANELLLAAPEFRMRTRNGHAVRVTADRGTVEAPRRAGTGIEPKRGRLVGHVVIEYDRLTESQRALLPEAVRDRLDPDDLIRIEADRLLFDFEYSKVSVPGRLRLTSRDAELEANDLELRFDELEDRLEYLRIARGGRIVLRGSSDRLSMSRSDGAGPGQKQTTVSQWLLATVRSGLLKKPSAEADQTSPSSSSPRPAVTYNDEGTPVFDLSAAADEPAKQPARYYARFNGDVDVTQTVGASVQARLQADLLELVRAVTNRDESRKRDAEAPRVADSTPTVEEADERLVLTWRDRLVVEACAPDDQRCSKDTAATLSATGSPARITTPEGDVRCERFTYDRNGSRAQLFGTRAEPFVVRYGDQGTLTGLTVVTERRGDEFFIRATGHGSLTNGPLGETPLGPGSDSTITFDDGFEARGRVVTRTRIDLTGGLTSETQRILSRATFRGRVQVNTADAGLGADTVTVTFGPRVGAVGAGRIIDRIHAEGHVVMTRRNDRVTCRQIEMSLTTTPDGRTVLRQAVAYGQVVARQGGRTIEAREKLIIDFDQIDRPPPPFDPAVAYAKAVSAGVDPLAVDWAAQRSKYEASRRVEVVVSRLRAEGEVRILDSGQALDVAANKVDCVVSEDGDIQTALIEGLGEQPATVRLGELSVTGTSITVNAPNEWVDVPGAGRMTFRSPKDLDGRRLAQPVPISITWTDWMQYRGRRNRSVFEGKVHCSSQTTTFDSARLEVEFVDRAETATDEAPARDWWIFEDVVERFSQSGSGRSGLSGRRFTKEPAYVLATGRAVALTTDLDTASGETKGRARIAGPMLWVNLREDGSKMQIEGPGTLLLEDYPSVDAIVDAPQKGGGLFQIADDGGPSNTLIEWRELMWYDFAADQMRFEGDVSLKHFSGAELMRVRGRPAGESTALPPGRATFLWCRALTVDFSFRPAAGDRKETRRLGRLSSERLSQFQAEGAVRLQDESEGLYLTADRVVYWKARETLGIYGSPGRKAQIVQRREGELPTQLSVERFLYNFATGLELAAGPRVRSR